MSSRRKTHGKYRNTPLATCLCCESLRPRPETPQAVDPQACFSAVFLTAHSPKEEAQSPLNGEGGGPSWTRTLVMGLVHGGYMTRRYHARRQSRQALLWRVFYGSGELVGQGSIVDVHKNGCRISGRMPVEVGSHLRLCIWPTDNPTDIVVAQGTVRWAPWT